MAPLLSRTLDGIADLPPIPFACVILPAALAPFAVAAVILSAIFRAVAS